MCTPQQNKVCLEISYRAHVLMNTIWLSNSDIEVLEIESWINLTGYHLVGLQNLWDANIYKMVE